MKAKVFTIIFTAILLLVACKKEVGDIEYKIIHWPAVKTLVATNVDSTIAKLNGTVNGYGLSTTVTFEYGITTSYGNTVTASQGPVTGDSITNVSADISGLHTSSTYHFRIKAENSRWINFYGSDTIFHTIPSVTDVDSNIYYSVRIGSQVWMQENLKTTRYNNGDLIGTTTPATLSVFGETSPKYQWPCNNEPCVNDERYVDTYGRLYTWYAVTDIRGVCPTGWHVPSNDEWHLLYYYLGGSPESISNVADKLKESGTSHWLSPNDGATNESGFTALPAGFRENTYKFRGYDEFMGLGHYAHWWLSTEGFSPNLAVYWSLECNSEMCHDAQDGKDSGKSVRCIKDD
jgi:uncharacterized protein (TIGR02145 family)